MPALWTVVLRCYNCGRKFTIRRLPLDRVLVICPVTPCPHCGLSPYVAPRPNYAEPSKLHRIFDLKEDTDVIYRKSRNGDTWHCDHSCSRWPEDDYLELEFQPVTEPVCSECKLIQLDNAF